jgi:hypothetical protein
MARRGLRVARPPPRDRGRRRGGPRHARGGPARPPARPRDRDAGWRVERFMGDDVVDTPEVVLSALRRLLGTSRDD